MHKMKIQSKGLTIAGLVIEGFAIVFFAVFGIIFRVLTATPRDELLAQGWHEFFVDLVIVMSVIFIVFGIILLMMLPINIVLFTRLMRGKFNDEQAKKVYIYQAIWGGVSLLFNTITGVLYLISAVIEQERFITDKERQNRED